MTPIERAELMARRKTLVDDIETMMFTAYLPMSATDSIVRQLKEIMRQPVIACEDIGANGVVQIEGEP